MLFHLNLALKTESLLFIHLDKEIVPISTEWKVKKGTVQTIKTQYWLLIYKIAAERE